MNIRVVPFSSLALSGCWLLFILASPLIPAVEPERPTIQISRVGELQLKNLFVHSGAVISETSVVVVGSTEMDDEKPKSLDEYGPNGAIVDLDKRVSRQFTNGHMGYLRTVGASNGRLLTGGSTRDPTVCVWDIAAAKTTNVVEVANPETRAGSEAAWFHKSNRVAVTSTDRLVVLDPDKPGGRTEYEQPKGLKGWYCKPVVSLYDSQIACPVIGGQVVIWDVKTRKATVTSLIPENAKEPERWLTSGIAFAPDGSLIAWRGWGVQVPDGKAESDVPAEMRAIVRVELPGGRITPLGMGHTGHTFSCSIDSTGKWLATAGSSGPDKPLPGGVNTVGELRVYHMPTGKLAFREQTGPPSLSWVSFTPSGKRVVASSPEGKVIWWDVKPK